MRAGTSPQQPSILRKSAVLSFFRSRFTRTTFLRYNQRMNVLLAMQGAVAQGVLWGIMTVGVFMTFRILNIADMTCDGSFALGGSACAAEDEGLPIPKPTQQSKIFCKNNEEMSLINADTLKYRKTTLQLSANA